MALIEIKHWKGKTLHTIEADSIKTAIEALVKLGANLWGANLEAANLEAANLEAANLKGANLWGANLRAANLETANLWGANLRAANLRGANLEDANLETANLWGANLRAANLRGANLEDANLETANLWGANLRAANLRGASYGEGVPLTKEPIIITGLLWSVIVLDEYLKIGCEIHLFNDWDRFPDSRIKVMHPKALGWWKTHKGAIMAMVKAVR